MRVVLDKLTEIFYDVDDFATVFMPENGNGDVNFGILGDTILWNFGNFGDTILNYATIQPWHD